MHHSLSTYISILIFLLIFLLNIWKNEILGLSSEVIRFSESLKRCQRATNLIYPLQPYFLNSNEIIKLLIALNSVLIQAKVFVGGVHSTSLHLTYHQYLSNFPGSVIVYPWKALGASQAGHKSIPTMNLNEGFWHHLYSWFQMYIYIHICYIHL